MLVLQVAAGTAAGAVVGMLFGRVHVCSTQGCTGRGSRLAGMIAGAVCGGLLMYWVVRR